MRTFKWIVNEEGMKFRCGDLIIPMRPSSDGWVISPAWNDLKYTFTEEGDRKINAHVKNEKTDETLYSENYPTYHDFGLDFYKVFRRDGRFNLAHELDTEMELIRYDNEKILSILRDNGAVHLGETERVIDFMSMHDILSEMSRSELAHYVDRTTYTVDIREALTDDHNHYMHPSTGEQVLTLGDGIVEMSPDLLSDQIRNVRFMDLMLRVFEDSL